MYIQIMPYSEYVEVMGHEPELVTPVELYEIYQKNPVDLKCPSREEIEKKIRIVDGGVVADFQLKGTGGGAIYLRMHIMLEAYLLTKKPHEVEWDEKTLFNLEHEILMIEKWVHPYVWYDPTRVDGVISDGRIACEMYIPQRSLEVLPYINYLEECRLLSFADAVPEYTNPEVRHKKGTHDWKWLSGNYRSLVTGALNGEELRDEDYESIVWYDAYVLRCNLEHIAEKRGSNRAAELLRMFQKEWKDVKRWGVDMGEMEEEEIEAFEDMLMEDFDDLLEEWESAREEPEVEESRYSKYIVAERFTEIYKGQDYTIEDYENTLHDAAKGSAKHFAGVLENGLKAGILNAHGDGKKAILAYFKDRFPDMTTYSYQYFSDVFTLPN